MTAVIVPPRAGVLSAVGLLSAPRQVDLVRSWPTPQAHAGLEDALRALGVEAELEGGTVTTSVDCRYAGQGHEITVPTVEDFSRVHRQVNGYDRPGAAVEVVAIRAQSRVASVGAPAAVVDRATFLGPASVVETDCTVWVPDGWRAEVHPSGSWIVRRS
jgi:N-methylhydantoinase A/oxoprolinase/acetone carboxylase beta subunit